MSLIIDEYINNINKSRLDNEVKKVQVKYIEKFKSVGFNDLEDWNFIRSNGFKGRRFTVLRQRFIEMVNRAINNDSRVNSEDWTQFYKIPKTFDEEGNEMPVNF